ncbi:LysR substrate-binding domain-containing protein [Paraburkholderia agricolaris]|uniref:LysR substrate-binding domain-containing protein n=1 Tax=Paraburkholderia agricolaris TaxID=2152888 RepID=A0ABW8ZU37_9BURK
MHALPSINHLRSFQVIGHHLNLVRAAEELHLTSSALSYQLGVLEQRLGVKLFVRTGRGLAFTNAGRVLHDEVDECLQRLWAAVQRASTSDIKAPLVVSSLPTFAMRWLLPRFADVQEHFREIEIRVSIAEVNFERDAIDCAIAYGNGHWLGVGCDFLREETLILVCAPTAPGTSPMASVGDLHERTLLSAKQRPDDWAIWFKAAGHTPPTHARHLMLASRNMVIQAATEGLGVAVVDPAMIRPELESGRLIQALPCVANGGGSYYLLYPQGDENWLRISAFRTWLLGEIGGQ